MTIPEFRLGSDGTLVVHAPERNAALPWTVVWAAPGQRSHWPTQQLSPQAVGAWSTLRPTTEYQEVV